MLHLLLHACTPLLATTTVETSDTMVGTLNDTALAVAPPHIWEGNLKDHAGTSLCGVGDRLAVGAPGPGPGYWEDISKPGLYLPEIRGVETMWRDSPQINAVGESGADVDSTRFGEQVICPGDLTGTGEVDVVATDPSPSSALPVDAYLFEGPLDDTDDFRTTQEDGVPIDWADLVRGTTCGDVSGDGADDLCLNTGIAFGPVTEPITADITWSTVADPRDILLAGADLDGDGALELVLTEPAALAVHRITTFAPGDQTLSTWATTTWTAPATPTVLHAARDLDGDGLEDLVVAWADAVAVATDTTGGDLSTAHTTLAWPGVTAITSGDVDGDGAADLVVAAGAEVRIFLGPLAGGALSPESAAKVLVGEQHPTDRFGEALLTADIDGDGDDELFVGSPGYTNPASGNEIPGRVYRYDEPMLAP